MNKLPVELDLYRFFSKVKYSDDCWEWLGCKRIGYGQFWYNGVSVGAHRWSLMFFKDMDITNRSAWACHLCNNPGCVNPFHLYEGTAQSNAWDSVKLNTHYCKAKTHCSRGHEFTKENTVKTKNRRYCRKCRNARALAAYHKRFKNDPLFRKQRMLKARKDRRAKYGESE